MARSASLGALVVRGVFLGGRRLASDPVGRTAILATAACAVGVISLLWSASAIATQLIDREVFARRLGIGATAVEFEGGAGLTAADIRAIRLDPRVLVTCERAASLVVPMGAVIPIRLIATTPAYFRYRAASLLDGQSLVWTDTLAPLQRVVVGAGLFRTRSTRLDLADGRADIVGRFAPRSMANEDFVVVSLLGDEDIARACAEDARRSVAVIAPPGRLPQVRAQVQQLIAAHRGVPAAHLPMRSSLSSRAVALWTNAQLATRSALFGATLLVAFAAAFTIAVLLEVRTESRRFELGLARAIGATRHDLAAELVAEAALLSITALLAGLIPAWLLATATSEALGVDRPSAVVFFWPGVLVASVTIAAAAWPLRQAARRPPIASLNSETW